MRLAVLAALLPCAAFAAPSRVVSMNVCTDQLAMLMAAPGQLVSISYLARDPQMSSLSAAAQDYPVNRGRAEEIFLARPDLVLAGIYPRRETLALLEDLGVRVERFAPATSLEEARATILRVGDLLGRRDAARAMVDALDAGLAEVARGIGARPGAVLYGANGYATGAGTLSDEVLRAGGFRNLAPERGGGRMSLEALALARPDVVITPKPYPGGSRAEEILSHPVLRELTRAPLQSADWVCATPFLLEAVESLDDLRQSLE